jgi:hypothetical protein
MSSEKQIRNNKLELNQLTVAETIKGANGKPLFFEWSKTPEDLENCSREEIARSYRIRGD